MSMLSLQVDRLRKYAERLRQLANGAVNQGFPARQDLYESAAEMREAADTIENLRDRIQAASETCSIEWRGESYDTDAGREYDGAYFCTKCRADLPYPLQECWDDYQALVADYGNVPPWDKKPFCHCPNCGREVVDA